MVKKNTKVLKFLKLNSFNYLENNNFILISHIYKNFLFKKIGLDITNSFDMKRFWEIFSIDYQVFYDYRDSDNVFYFAYKIINQKQFDYSLIKFGCDYN